MINTDCFNILEFNKVLNFIAGLSHSEISRKSILDIQPKTQRDEIEERYGQVQEIRTLGQRGTPLVIGDFGGISEMITRVRPDGAVLEATEVLDLTSVLKIIVKLSAQLNRARDLIKLAELGGNLTGFPEIVRKVENSIDPDGHILDTASTLLSQLRSKKRSLESGIRKRLEEITREKSVVPFLQDDFITRRSGRWVIPIRMDSKGQVPGVVHDVSRSGETAFTEPLEIIGIANELENISAEERAEEIRILKAISRLIREAADQIEEQYRTLVYFDLLNSIAVFADLLRMEVPELNEKSEIRLVNARHPLLMLLQKDHVQKVVPLDLSLGGDHDVMVISGPNAGGKTVAIKTTGLLLLMALSGIPVPACSNSSFPIIDGLLVDLGDEQSIEDSLSTFSAHIANISEILKCAGKNTLVLIDELGTGTDPAQGAALACAILKDLKEKNSLVIATTHLAEILGFVYRSDCMVNASMEIDPQTLNPLYRLRIGEPGQSHALETAGKYGLPENVVQTARALLGSARLEWQNLLEELQEKRAMHEAAILQVGKERQGLAEKEARLQEKLKEAERQGKEALQSAYKEAAVIVSEIRRQVYGILEEARKERGRESMRKIIRVQHDLGERLAEFEGKSSLSINDVKEGDTVFVKSIGYDASVIKVDRRHERLRLKAGLMELEVSVSDVSRSQGKLPKGEKKESKSTAAETPPAKLNLIGLRVEEAVSKLDPLIDRGFRSGLKEIKVVHGFGTGALQKAVRKYLGTHPLINNFRPGDPAEGGDGVTIVYLES